jgi:hypothetical protein
VEDRLVTAPSVVVPVTSGNGVVPASSRTEAERIAALVLQDG